MPQPIKNIYLHYIYHFSFSFLLILKTTLITLVKLVVPYRYRCKSVKGETVLVTGAGSGIGKLMAKRFAKLGAKLVLVDIDAKANEITANEILVEGGTASTFRCDLSKKEDIYRAADEIKKTVGNVDILINNAGIVTGKKFLEASDESIEKTMAVNTMSHFWMSKCFLPSMVEKNHGHIVTISSLAGIFGTASLCDYSASKYAVVGFDDALRLELSRLNKTGVKTTCVCPYYIDTGMFEGTSCEVIPFLKPEYAVDRIVEAILTDQPLLILPRFFYMFYFFNGFIGTEVRDYMATEFLRASSSMDDFRGRKKTN